MWREIHRYTRPHMQGEKIWFHTAGLLILIVLTIIHINGNRIVSTSLIGGLTGQDMTIRQATYLNLA